RWSKGLGNSGDAQKSAACDEAAMQERVYAWIVHEDPTYGILISQRCLSLFASNLDSVAELAPTADSAIDSLEFGIPFGSIRQLASGSCSIRHSCSAPPVNAGNTTNSPPSVAASARSVPATVILK